MRTRRAYSYQIFGQVPDDLARMRQLYEYLRSKGFRVTKFKRLGNPEPGGVKAEIVFSVWRGREFIANMPHEVSCRLPQPIDDKFWGGEWNKRQDERRGRTQTNGATVSQNVPTTATDATPATA